MKKQPGICWRKRRLFNKCQAVFFHNELEGSFINHMWDKSRRVVLFLASKALALKCSHNSVSNEQKPFFQQQDIFWTKDRPLAWRQFFRVNKQMPKFQPVFAIFQMCDQQLGQRSHIWNIRWLFPESISARAAPSWSLSNVMPLHYWPQQMTQSPRFLK